MLLYYIQKIFDQIPILFYTTLQNKSEFIKLAWFWNFHTGTAIHSAWLLDFPIPRCYHLSSAETLQILCVFFWRTVGLSRFDRTWCTEDYQGSPFTVSKAEQKTAATFFFVRFGENTAKHTAKPGKVKSARSGLATCYITRSFPLCPLLLKWGKKKKNHLGKNTDIFVTSGALEMQT